MRTIQSIGYTLATLAISGFVVAPYAPVSFSFAEGEVSSSSSAASAESVEVSQESPMSSSASAEQSQSASSSEEAVATEEAQAAKDDSGELSEEEAKAKKSDEAKKEKEEAEEVDKKTKEALEEAERAREKAGDAVSSLHSLEGKLAAARADYEAALKAVAKLEKKKAKLEKRIENLEAEIERAQSVIDACKAEIESSAGTDLLTVFMGNATFDDIDSRAYLLNKVIEDRREALYEAAELREKRDALIEKIDKSIKAAKAKERETVKAGNAAAFDVERQASKVRVYDADAQSALEKANKKSEDVEKAKQSNSDAEKSHDSTRKTVDGSVANWYDLVDATSEEEHAISYGEGADFALDEKDFVEKWAAANSEFLGDGPIAPYAETIATMAYKYKVDPRLCAAVSIIESGGGVACIKPHNAWGWGAADSNPYGLASGWSSWEEAIEAWHKGMAESTTGLATAGTLDELGAIYCSSAEWTEHVATEMEKISALAKDVDEKDAAGEKVSADEKDSAGEKKSEKQ